MRDMSDWRLTASQRRRFRNTISINRQRASIDDLVERVEDHLHGFRPEKPCGRRGCSPTTSGFTAHDAKKLLRARLEAVREAGLSAENVEVSGLSGQPLSSTFAL
jgi:hypothetical protein